jgi:hypothetical protein
MRPEVIAGPIERRARPSKVALVIFDGSSAPEVKGIVSIAIQARRRRLFIGGL